MSSQNVNKKNNPILISLFIFTFFILGAHSAFAADYYKTGSIVSTNLLTGLTDVGAITQFSATAAITTGQTIKVQFSRNQESWYDHSGTVWAEDTLVNGSNILDITALGWTGPVFYYKMQFTTDNIAYTASTTDVAVDYTVVVGSATGYYKTGSIVSTNLLTGLTNVGAITQFSATVSSLPAGTTAKIQFSRNQESWYDRNGTVWAEDTLANGANTIDLTALGWTGPVFYYKIKFTADTVNYPGVTAAVTAVAINYSTGSEDVYFKQGALVSTNLLAGGGTLTGNEKFGYNLSSLPPGTTATVQFSTSTSNSEWYSSSGTLWGANTLSLGNHLTDATSISLSALNLTGTNFYYKLQFTTSNNAGTPAVTEIQLFSLGEGAAVQSHVKARGGGTTANPSIKIRGGGSGNGVKFR